MLFAVATASQNAMGAGAHCAKRSRGRAWVAGMFPDGGKRLSNTRNVIRESALEIYRTRMWDRVRRARGSVRNVIRRSDEKVSGAHPNKNKKQKTRAEMKTNNVRKASRT